MKTITINDLKYRKHININGETKYKLDNIMWVEEDEKSKKLKYEGKEWILKVEKLKVWEGEM
jgi:hypothetical protein